ncbi:hypothetical protein F4809DRAFT_630448 [Biscogniauxia mediterranea]|nr:hypothetical protein F4809DRAFT_630448 [Biscogniauxia mediterranea]
MTQLAMRLHSTYIPIYIYMCVCVGSVHYIYVRTQVIYMKFPAPDPPIFILFYFFVGFGCYFWGGERLLARP